MSKECRYCKKQNLHWQEHEGNWRLFDRRNELHECTEYLLEHCPKEITIYNLFILMYWRLQELNSEVLGIGW